MPQFAIKILPIYVFPPDSPEGFYLTTFVMFSNTFLFLKQVTRVLKPYIIGVCADFIRLFKNHQDVTYSLRLCFMFLYNCRIMSPSFFIFVCNQIIYSVKKINKFVKKY